MTTLVVVLLCALFVIGIPVGFALIIAVIPYFATVGSIPMQVVIQRFIASTESISLLAIPFFITAGSIMTYSGITDVLMGLAEMLVGHIRGSLGHVNVILSAMMGGLSGSCAADAAQDCKILVPTMVKQGYDKEFCASVTAASSLITCIIPPSIGMVVYAYCTDTSVGKMLASGYIPGLLMMVSQMVLVHILAKKRNYPVSREKPASAKEFGKAFIKSLPALGLPVLLIVGLRFGIFSATEGGAMCALYSLIVGKFVYKKIRKEHFIPILKDAVRSSCTVMLVMCAANIFSYFLSWERIPQQVSTFLSGAITNPTLFMLMVVALFLVIGMFMDGTSAMIVIAPIFAPVVKAMGIDMVYFGCIMVLCCALGAITPPFGAVIYLISPLLRMRVSDFIKELFPFILVTIAVIVLMVFLPEIVTLIPNLLYG